MTFTPLTIELAVYGAVFMLSLWSGLIRYYQNIRYKGVKFHIGDVIMEMLTSALVGLLVFFYCEWKKWDPMLTMLMIALGAYNGPAWLKGLEKYFKNLMFRSK